MEEVETGTGTKSDIASYLLREDSLELQFLYVSQIQIAMRQFMAPFFLVRYELTNDY